jgi:serine/threonine protein kinase
MDRIGKYKVLELLGQGGTGAVYRARGPVAGRDVAVKVIHDRAMDVPAVRDRFYREARLARTLAHEHVATLYDAGEDEGRLYLVTELLDGTDLRRLLDERSLPPLDARLDLAAQLARGLAYAHDRGIVHRDVRPENVGVTSTRRVKILDFGIAWAAAEAVLTPAPGRVATGKYMSPEQISGGAVDHRTDVFSFGVVLYELLTGAAPFRGDHFTAIIREILYGEPLPLVVADDEATHEAERALQRVVERCLAKEPEGRYGSLLEAAEALDRVREALDGGTPKAQPAPSRRRSRRGPAAPVAPMPEAPASRFMTPQASLPADPNGSPAAPAIERRRITREEVLEAVSMASLTATDDDDAIAPPFDPWPMPEPPAEAVPSEPPASPPETTEERAESEPGRERARVSWARPLVLGVALLALLGAAGVFLLGRSADPEDETVREASQASARLEASATAALTRMRAARDAAVAAGADTSAAFRRALAQARAAEAALSAGGEAGLTHAATAAREAAALFGGAHRETLALEDSLRQQAAGAEQSALAARRAATSRRGGPAAALLTRAEEALAAGRRAWADSSFADAARLFADAERGFREAGAARDRERPREDAERAQRETLAARERARATDWNSDDYRLIRQAEERLRAGDRHLRQGSYSSARRAYGEAARIYHQVSTAPPAPPDSSRSR